MQQTPLRIFYASGPGDVAGTFRHWKAGRDDPSQVAITYSSQFFEACRKLNARVLVTAACPRPDRLADGLFELEHRPIPLFKAAGAWHHVGQILYALRLVRQAANFGAHVALVSDVHYAWLLAPLRLFGIEVVVSLHCAFWPAGKRSPKRLNRVIDRLNGWFWTHIAAATICVSPECERQVRQIAPRCRGPIYQVRAQYREDYLQTLQPPAWDGPPWHIMYAGRIERPKGVFDLLEVAHRLQQREPGRFRWEVCGEGSALAELREQATRRRLDSVFLVHGRLDRSQMQHALGRSHATIVPTTTRFAEGLNKVAVESVIAGRPVITSRMSNALDVLGDAVLVTPPDDVAAYTAAVRQLFSDPDLFQRKRRACDSVRGQFVDRRFAWGHAVHALFDGVARQRRAPMQAVRPPRPLSQAQLDIVIVNYRTPDLTINCLRSIATRLHEAPRVRAVVVDNASNDGSIESLRRAIDANQWHEWVTLLPLDRNYGFAGGNNRGLEALGHAAPYVLLLNSDTLVEPGVLRHCCELMDRERKIGVMSCMLRNPDGSPQNTARRFPTPLRQAISSFGLPWIWPQLFAWADVEDPAWDRRTVRRDVDWLGGAFMMIRREALEQVGPLDEDFFFYGEDIEFCHRFHRAGWRCYYDPTVAITHLGGASSDPTRLAERQRSLHVWQARYLVQRKCFGRAAAALVRAADVLAHGLRCLKLRFARRRREEYQAQRQLFQMLLSMKLI